MPERRPGNLLHRFVPQSNQPALPVDDPDITGGILRNRKHVSAGNGADGDEPIILQIAEVAAGRDPDAPPMILEQRMRAQPIEKPAVTSESRNLPVVPSTQAERSAQPDASIPGAQQGPHQRVEQSLFFGPGGNQKVTKGIEAAQVATQILPSRSSKRSRTEF